MVTREKFGIFKGELAKYQLTITREDFDVQTCDFSVRLSYGMFGQYVDIGKNDMFRDEEWHVFFMFDTTEMTGPIKATTTYYLPDTDTDGGVRECTDVQVIGFVTDSSCQQMQRCRMRCRRSEYVTFERIERSDASTIWLELRTKDGEVLRTSDGEILRVKKTNLN